jgi:hypothetical protein
VKIVLPIDASVSGVSSGVEFVPKSDVKRVFGLPPDRAKLLAARGEIDSFYIKEFGSAHGLWLYSAASIRAYLRKHQEKPVARKVSKETAK